MRWRRAMSLAGACVVPVACAGEPPEVKVVTAPPVESAVERGPVHFTVRADPGKITVGQRLRLTLEVTAGEGVEIRMPQPSGSIGPFAIRETFTPPDVPEGDMRRVTHTFVLDTFTAGDAEIPGFTVGFVDTAPADGPVEGELVSDPLTVAVQSVLVDEFTPADHRDIKSPVEVPVESDLPIGAALGVVGVLAVVAVIWLLLRRRRGMAAEVTPPIIPHAWAHELLDELEARGLLEERRFQEYYYALSDIVRRYIELRFHIMAPERTTEEFLRETRAHAALSDEHRTLLSGFLRAADMVKFARHEPGPAEGRAALGAARHFVTETTPPDRTGPAREEAA